MATSKFLKANNQADFHRRKMGLNQKFKSIKIKKEKGSKVPYVSVEEKLKLHSTCKILSIILITSFVMGIMAVYVNLKAECSGNREEDKAAQKMDSQPSQYCQHFNQFQLILKKLLHTVDTVLKNL